MTGFNDSSDMDQLFEDPAFQAEIAQACKSVFKKYKEFPNPLYDSWEDLMSDVYLHLKSKQFFFEYRRITNEKGYLYKVARNVLIDKYRRQRGELNRIDMPDLERIAGASTEEKAYLNIFIKELSQETTTLLTPGERYVLGAYVEDVSFAEVGRELHLTRQTIQKRFVTAIKKLRQHVTRGNRARRKT